MTAPFGLSSDSLSGSSMAHWPLQGSLASSLDDDFCVTSESPCVMSAPLREHRSLLASASEVQSTCTVGSQYLVPCSRLPACAVPLLCFCLWWMCNILSGAESVHEHVPPCGKNPVCLTLCSRSSVICLSLHSDRHVTLLAFLAQVPQLLPLVLRLRPV